MEWLLQLKPGFWYYGHILINFYIVGLFIFGVALDMAMAAFPSAWQVHMAAIGFCAAAGLIAAGSISWRMVRRWK